MEEPQGSPPEKDTSLEEGESSGHQEDAANTAEGESGLEKNGDTPTEHVGEGEQVEEQQESPDIGTKTETPVQLSSPSSPVVQSDAATKILDGILNMSSESIGSCPHKATELVEKVVKPLTNEDALEGVRDQPVVLEEYRRSVGQVGIERIFERQLEAGIVNEDGEVIASSVISKDDDGDDAMIVASTPNGTVEIPNVPNNTNIVVRGVPPEVDEGGVHKRLRVHGEILACRLSEVQSFGKTLAFVHFEKPIEAWNAVRMEHLNKWRGCRPEVMFFNTFMKEELKREALEKQVADEYNAATNIQRIFRGYVGRKEAHLHVVDRNKWNQVIEGRKMRMKEYLNTPQHMHAAIRIQAWWRMIIIQKMMHQHSMWSAKYEPDIHSQRIHRQKLNMIRSIAAKRDIIYSTQLKHNLNDFTLRDKIKTMKQKDSMAWRVREEKRGHYAAYGRREMARAVASKSEQIVDSLEVISDLKMKSYNDSHRIMKDRIRKHELRKYTLKARTQGSHKVESELSQVIERKERMLRSFDTSVSPPPRPTFDESPFPTPGRSPTAFDEEARKVDLSAYPVSTLYPMNHKEVMMKTQQDMLRTEASFGMESQRYLQMRIMRKFPPQARLNTKKYRHGILDPLESDMSSRPTSRSSRKGRKSAAPPRAKSRSDSVSSTTQVDVQYDYGTPEVSTMTIKSHSKVGAEFAQQFGTNYLNQTF